MKNEITTVREAEALIQRVLNQMIREAPEKITKEELQEILERRYPRSFLDRLHLKRKKKANEHRCKAIYRRDYQEH